MTSPGSVTNRDPIQQGNKVVARSKDKSKPASRSPLVLDHYPPYLFHLITSHLNNRLLDRMRPHGVTVQRWRVLMVLMNGDGRTMTDLVRMTLIAQPAVSRVIDQMERNGLVERRVAERDNRIVEVFLTQHGRDTYWKIAPDAEKHGIDMLAGFDASERKQLFELLRRLLDNVSQNPAAPGEE
jgi:MarR family transcriptional regulator, organic hydroperoxide resistance regulator